MNIDNHKLQFNEDIANHRNININTDSNYNGDKPKTISNDS